MSVSTRRQAMQPTDIGVPGPTPRDMARAFRSVRADPLSFLTGVSERFGDLVYTVLRRSVRWRGRDVDLRAPAEEVV